VTKAEKTGAGSDCYQRQAIEKQASGRQPNRVAIWKAQHIGLYVSIGKSHATQDHGLRRRFSTAC
jgi:hypothetical protein